MDFFLPGSSAGRLCSTCIAEIADFTISLRNCDKFTSFKLVRCHLRGNGLQGNGEFFFTENLNILLKFMPYLFILYVI